MYTGYELVELKNENPLRDKGKYSVSKLWKLYKEKIIDTVINGTETDCPRIEQKVVREYSLSGYTTEEAAQEALSKS